MMPRSGLSPNSIKYAYEMGTSEIHRTSIMLAAAAPSTNRSMYPRDLSRRPRQKPEPESEPEPEPRISTKPLRRINCCAQNRMTGTSPLPKS